MTLNSLAPNAHYDLVFGRPATIEHDNDGSTIFRFNIVEETGIPEGEKKEKLIGWACREIRIFAQPTKANIKKAIIRSVLDETAEFDLVNSYNKHILGIVKDESAVAKYKEYLQFTEDLDALIVNSI